MKLFTSNRTEAHPERFSGEGTVLMSQVTGLENLASILNPAELIEFLNEHQTTQQRIIAEQKGVAYLFVGDAIIAYWHGLDSKRECAIQAFQAARKLLAAAPEAVDYRVCLGSGPLAGAYFGPVAQFQVVGAAMTEATLLTHVAFPAHRVILFAQSTKELLPEGDFEFTVTDELPDSVLAFMFVPPKNRGAGAPKVPKR
jgi:class 3 adenylate cyclase